MSDRLKISGVTITAPSTYSPGDRIAAVLVGEVDTETRDTSGDLVWVVKPDAELSMILDRGKATQMVKATRAARAAVASGLGDTDQLPLGGADDVPSHNRPTPDDVLETRVPTDALDDDLDGEGDPPDGVVALADWPDDPEPDDIGKGDGEVEGDPVEPWAGYDDANMPAIISELASQFYDLPGTDDSRAELLADVNAHEMTRSRPRKGVLDALRGLAEVLAAESAPMPEPDGTRAGTDEGPEQ